MTLQHRTWRQRDTYYTRHAVYGPHGVLEYKRHPHGGGDLDLIEVHRPSCWDGCEAAAGHTPCPGAPCRVIETGCHWSVPWWLDTLAHDLYDTDETTMWRLLDQTYPQAMTTTNTHYTQDNKERGA